MKKLIFGLAALAAVAFVAPAQAWGPTTNFRFGGGFGYGAGARGLGIAANALDLAAGVYGINRFNGGFGYGNNFALNRALRQQALLNASLHQQAFLSSSIYNQQALLINSAPRVIHQQSPPIIVQSPPQVIHQQAPPVVIQDQAPVLLESDLQILAPNQCLHGANLGFAAVPDFFNTVPFGVQQQIIGLPIGSQFIFGGHVHRVGRDRVIERGPRQRPPQQAPRPNPNRRDPNVRP